MDHKDYYQILGVDKHASADDIKKAFRKLARKYHPDISKEKNAAQRMAELNEANTVLSDPEKRAAYDSMAECGYGLACIMTQHRDISYCPASSTPDALNHFILRDPIDAVVTAPEASIENAFDMPVGQGVATPSANKKTVFIVDDDTGSLNIYAAILARTDNVEVFIHAEDILYHFTAMKPALVISDLAMAGMDGLTLRRHLSSLEGGDTVPFIFLGNTAAIAHERYVTQAGIDDYLCKPVSPDRLLAVSERLIERAASFTAALHGKMNTRITALLHPQLPTRHAQWRIATRSAAAATGGGDFTLCRADNAGFIAVLADVMGHGQNAKFFAYAYAGYLRSLMNSSEGSGEPARFLSRVSAAVNADSFLDSTIMTCISFSLCPDGRITLASAGHPPPWLVDGGHHAHALKVAGPLPGLLGESRYVEKSLMLTTGQRIVLGTDGFWDSWDHAQNLSFDLRTGHTLPLEEYADSLWRRALERAQTRHRLKDDATLIVIESGGTS